MLAVRRESGEPLLQIGDVVTIALHGDTAPVRGLKDDEQALCVHCFAGVCDGQLQSKSLQSKFKRRSDHPAALDANRCRTAAPS